MFFLVSPDAEAGAVAAGWAGGPAHFSIRGGLQCRPGRDGDGGAEEGQARPGTKAQGPGKGDCSFGIFQFRLFFLILELSS